MPTGVTLLQLPDSIHYVNLLQLAEWILHLPDRSIRHHTIEPSLHAHWTAEDNLVGGTSWVNITCSLLDLY